MRLRVSKTLAEFFTVQVQRSFESGEVARFENRKKRENCRFISTCGYGSFYLLPPLLPVFRTWRRFNVQAKEKSNQNNNKKIVRI